jgi:putative peptidoglycan lipid II flippase
LFHLGIQLPGLLGIKTSVPKIHFLPNWRVPGVREVMGLMGPRVLGLAVAQINFIVNANFASLMVAGSYTALVNAWTLMFFALGIIGQSVGTAVFPSLAALAAEKDMPGFRDRLASALRGVLFLAIPSTLGLILLGRPLIALLYERGEFTPESTNATAWALAFFALGIAGHAGLEVLSRAFYALSDTRTPVVVGLASMLSNIVLSVIFIRFIGDPTSLEHGPFAGLALANSVTTLLEALALWWVLRRRIGSINDRYVWGGIWRTLVGAAAMSGGLYVLVTIAGDRLGTKLLAVVGIPLGAAVFLGVSVLFGMEEPRTVLSAVVRRIRR